MDKECETIIVTHKETSKRLDQLLAARFPGESRAYFQGLVRRGLVLLNGSISKKSTKLRLDDEIEVQFALTPELKLEPEPIPLNLVYEDEWLLVANKPAGLVVHPGVGNWSGTFVNGLLHHCQQLPEAEEPWRPGIVHRLDKDTSGLLIAAKTTMAQQRLVALFAERQVYKEYLLICVGKPPEGVIDAPIGRHPRERKRQAVIATGRPSQTVLEVIDSDGQLSLVRVILKTGRTHQIRVHLRHVGCPVLGDPVYGAASWNQKSKLNQQLLHAHRLSLTHPITGEKLECMAPTPIEWEKFYARFSATGESRHCSC